jgi:hypothetical protein
VTKSALVVGDELADHLVPPLRSELEAAGWQVRLLDATGLADASVSATVTGVWVDGVALDAVVFRLSLDLLVAPAFTEEDRSFAMNELRALWTHVLCLPAVRKINNGYAMSLLLRDPCAWRDLLHDEGIPVVPAQFGSVGPQSWWLRSSGELSQPPCALVAQTLGAVSVHATAIRSVLCCGGCVQGDDEALRPAAVRLCDAGLGLAELLVDEQDRVLTVSPEPAIAPGLAPWASRMLVRWLGAAPGR